MADLSEISVAADSAVAPQGELVQLSGSPFQLFQPYPPAGDQPAAIER
jgi:excinuclease ABC subunit B